ncbi:MAG: EamA family transporter [Pseudomonadales bacterium]|nr:DMT family transporter [Pseudomonadales bacterium]NIX09148.1 EamA family transporter [Pseudomonadales bacterium]
MNVLLGLNQSVVKLVNDGFAPVFQSGLRSACAIVPVLGYALVMRKRLSVTDGSLGLGMLNGLLFSAEFCLLFLALDYTSVARVSLFFYVMPVWVTIGAHFLVPGERMTVLKAAGLVLAVAGVALGLGIDAESAGEQAWIGDLLALCGAFFWASIALLTRTTRLQRCSPEMNLLYQLAVSAVILLAVAPLFGDTIREPTAAILGMFAFQVIVIVAIGFVVWFWILSIYPVSHMASFSLLAPVFGVFFGWLIFDDQITPAFVIALLLVGSGIVLINRSPAG